MNRRFRNRDNRHIARIYRSTKCVILEMQAKTLAYRAILADYARREKSMNNAVPEGMPLEQPPH